jgi:hypothetical protein
VRVYPNSIWRCSFSVNNDGSQYNGCHHDVIRQQAEFRFLKRLLPGRFLDDLVYRHGQHEQEAGNDQAYLILNTHQVQAVLYGTDN